MGTGLFWTQENLAEALGLPPAVIKRLSQALRMPAGFYAPAPGRPRLVLYAPEEVAALRQLNALIIAGASMAEAKAQVLAECSEAEGLPVAVASAPGGLLASGPENHEGYATYESETLRAQLAEVTFAQYRQQRPPSESVFQRLVKRLAAEGGLSALPTEGISATATGPVRLASPFEGVPSNAWMTPLFSSRRVTLSPR